MNVAKIGYNLGNMKDCEKQSATRKKETPKRHIITVVFEEKSMTMLEDKKITLQKCYELLSFLKDFDDNDGRREMTHFDILSLAGTTATF